MRFDVILAHYAIENCSEVVPINHVIPYSSGLRIGVKSAAVERAEKNEERTFKTEYYNINVLLSSTFYFFRLLYFFMNGTKDEL